MLKNVRGIKYYLPSDSIEFRYVENVLINVLNDFLYEEIKLPIIEYNSLYKNNIINNQEMYLFEDKKNNLLNLIPEGTLSCSKLLIKNNLLFNNDIKKLWYISPMFRYERPQKGRFRQFNQLGVEIYGKKDIYVDFELIFLSFIWLKKFNINNFVTLEINFIGSHEERCTYNKILFNFFKKDNFFSKFNYNVNNCISFLNNLNINDNYFKNIPKIINYINFNSRKYFDNFCKLLDKFKINYIINPFLFRGINYYNDIVFEWVINKSLYKNKKISICSGGRYDNLINKLCYKKCNIPAVGLGIGMERLIMLLKLCNFNFLFNKKIDILIICINPLLKMEAFFLSELIYNNICNIKISINYNYKKLKKHIKYAIKIKPKIVFLIGKKEIDLNCVTYKDLNKNTQIFIKKSEIVSFVKKKLINI